MSRTPVAHLAGLKVRYGGEWSFEQVKPEHVKPPDDDGGYIARRRDDRSVIRPDRGRARGAITREAITSGIASSAGVVTSAAVIMMAVFSIFASLHVLELKMLGIGLPAAILIDATIVRGILVPAAMAVLGDRCWYLPRWLCWLPGRRDRAPDPESRTPVPALTGRGS